MIKKIFLAIGLFTGLVGSFFSILEWDLRLLNSLFTGVSGLADGFLLVFNRLFAMSEQHQAFRYVMFTIYSPESAWDGNIAAALVIIMVLFAAISAVLVYTSRKIPVIIMLLIIVAVQVYFGVFPLALWNIILFASLAIMLVPDSSAAVVVPLVLISAVVWVAYPGMNLQLREFSESIRDRFDTRINPFAVAPQTAHDAIFQPEPEDRDLNVVYVQEDTLHESALEDYNVEHDELPLGAEIGFAAPQASLLPAILLVIAIAIIAAAIRFIPPLIKASRRRKMFDIDDSPIAINNMFVYMLEWLTVLGLKQKNIVFSAYASQLSVLVSPQYSKEYENLTALWREAVYSNHTLGENERQRMKEFLNKTTDIVWKSSDLRTKIKIRLHHFL